MEFILVMSEKMARWVIFSLFTTLQPVFLELKFFWIFFSYLTKVSQLILLNITVTKYQPNRKGTKKIAILSTA